MFLCTLVLGLCLASQVSSRGFYDLSLDFYDPIFTDPFDWKLLQELSPQYKNVLVSPISLKLILGLLYQGSTSQTEREFQSVLNYQSKEYVKGNYSQVLAALQTADRTEYLLNIGTSMFIDKQLHVIHKFEDIARQYFRTDIKPTDFGKPEEASKSINHWIEQLTHGKVKKIISANDLVQTLMLITNAIYFKGTWIHQFPKNQTRNGTFYSSPDYVQSRKMVKTVEYMTTTDEFLYYEDATLDTKVVRMEYKGSSYAMFILLPNSLGGLESLIKNINLSKIANIRFQMTQQDVEVTIPKFKFNFHAKLSQILQKFGLHQMFQNTASFTGIVESNSTLRRQLVVSDIVQKTGIEVDEEGSVVFSATEINVGNKFAENKIIFNASHPFMFFIEGPNGTILFVGKYEDPSETEASSVPNRWQDENPGDPNVNGAHHYQPVQPNNQYPQTTNQFNSPSDQSDTAEYSPGPNLNPNLDPDFYQPPEPDMDDLSHRFNLFDGELLNVFSDSPTNVLISPASIKTTLAMILEGAEGHCADEISEALRIPDIHQKGVRHILGELLNNLNEKATANTFLESHNAVFTSDKQRLEESYKNVVIKYYNAYLKSLDFSNGDYSAGVINQWASTSTRGAINEIISPQMISPEAYMVISNALYFKGKWKVAFDARSTATKCFHTAKGCVNVKMMHISDNFNYNYINTLRAYVVEIPYQDKFSMLLILPSSDANVRTVIRDLLHYRLSDIISSLNKSEIVLELPKFAFEYSVDLVEYLKTLRIRDVFSKEANLTKIIEGKNAFVNNLLHKTKIDVDEEGTTAAASTSAMIIPLMQPVTVAADKPFVFMIYHQQTKNIIFEGIVQNPEEKSSDNFYSGNNNSFKVPKTRTRSRGRF